MLYNYLVHKIKENFPFEPTKDQLNVIELIAQFLLSKDAKEILLIKGYAGVGKTSLIASVIQTMEQLKQPAVLLAPTGRAAKVFSSYASYPAFTIHKEIYRQKTQTDFQVDFSLDRNLKKQTTFFVDEASMISNQGYSDALFGTGYLLDDLISYVYSSDCRIVLLGDPAQLPPVGEEESPALRKDCLTVYGLTVSEYSLTEVVRQVKDSGVLANATAIRQYIQAEDYLSLPAFNLKPFADIKAISGSQLIESLSSDYQNYGVDETIVISRSNKRANVYNQGIRNTILYREEELSVGDRIMVVKNSYFWTEKIKEIDFIANGEILKVNRIRRIYELYGFRFADVLLSFPDYDDLELEAKIILDTLHSEAPALSYTDSERLYKAVAEDYVDIPRKKDRFDKIKSDEHFNALQVKFSYAVTCHKAQGGQWENVYIDQGYMTQEYVNSDYFKWLYTAITRATKQVYLVNFPKQQVGEYFE